MIVDDIQIKVRSLALGNIGEVDKGYINDLVAVKRFNNVGSWSFSLPSEYDMATELAQPGRGIVITGPGWSISGPMISATHKDSVDDPQGTLFFVGADDMIHLAHGQAFPDPAEEDPGLQTDDYDVRTDDAETLMREYVDVNRGPSAPASRRISSIALQTNLSRGDIVTARARFDYLGQLLSDIAAQGGGLGFDMVQNDTSIELAIYEPEDKSDVIRMDIDNDMLLKSEYGFGAPTATRVIVAGQGEGIDRKFIQVTSVDSLAAETAWGMKIEHFKDRRDTNDDTELTQEGEQIVIANGTTIKSLSVVPADDIENQEFGLNWFLGDIVAVIVDDQPLASVVTEAIILMDERGIRVGATLGDPVGFDYDAKLVAAQQDQEKRISLIEKNTQSSAAAPYAQDTAPVGAPAGSFWFNTAEGTLFYNYDDGTSTQWVEPSASWYDPGFEDRLDDLELRLQGVVPTSIDVGSGSASAADDGTVSGSGASRVSLNGVFVPDGIFDIYVSGDCSAGATISHRVRTAGTDYSTNNHAYVAVSENLSAGPTRTSSTTGTSAMFLNPTAAGSNSTFRGKVTIFVLDGKVYGLTSAISAANGDRVHWEEGFSISTATPDGISIICSAGTMSNLKMKVVRVI